MRSRNRPAGVEDTDPRASLRDSRTPNKMIDRIFAAIAFLAVVAFLGVVMVFVREVNLLIITTVVIGITAIFLWRETKPKDQNDAGGSRRGPQSGD